MLMSKKISHLVITQTDISYKTSIAIDVLKTYDIVEQMTAFMLSHLYLFGDFCFKMPYQIHIRIHFFLYEPTWS